MRWFLALLAMMMIMSLSGCSRDRRDLPLAPAKALESFRLSEDFTIEAFLTEPDVIDPVELAFDEYGRVYVAEMLDYPDDPPKGKPARSRIRLLEDRDGDGKYEHSAVYAEQVLQVSGLMPWKGGLIVTAAPEIFYLRDTNGDGKADERTVLFTGFPLVNPEARITNPRLSIDNWIYAANTGSNGSVTTVAHPERPPVLVRGADFRFHPVRGVGEAASGPTQYGMTFDDWGNRFQTQNTVHLRHSVVPMHYVARAPFLETGLLSENLYGEIAASVPLHPLTKPQAWREARTKLRQERYRETQPNRVEHVGGYFTAASGGTVYNGDAFPEEYRGNLFTGEVNGNLIRRDILTPRGVTFTAAPAKADVEFLASTDVWFRPCNFANAPDGLLYVADIYREFIETPESIPEEIKKGMDFWSGDTMGRIYRFVPKNRRTNRGLKVNLGDMSSAELVPLLDHENGWHRQTAQRLLLERQDKSVAPALRELARSAKPVGRTHALWMLEGIGELDQASVDRALGDGHAGVREQAVRLAERFLPALAPKVLALADDAEPRVQFQVALSLGEMRRGDLLDPRAVTALSAIAARHETDRWFRIAVLTSVAHNPAQVLPTLAPRPGSPLLPGVASLIGARKRPAELGQAMALIARLDKPKPVLEGLARGLQLVNASGLRAPQAEAELEKLIDRPDEETQLAAWEVARHFELRAVVARALRDATQENLAPERRVKAVRALRGGKLDDVAPVIEKVLGANPPSAVQVAAIDSLAAFDDPRVGPLMLAGWRSYSPDARAKTIAALLGAQSRLPLLLEALEDGRIEAAALDITARARLLEMGDRARKLIEAQTEDRMKVFEDYRPSLTMSSNVERGKALFDENCARCHSSRREGSRVGPDLSGINNKSKEELLLSILNPSYSIEPRYTNYIVTTKDGRIFDGVIVNETPSVITLRGGSDEGDQSVLRGDVAEIRASSVSLMPEEFEKTISHQGMADILGYLRGGL
ncbi:MAG: c-type cytochrome [Bryobacterales bacterium]|nr:c-type cytochrome [Bryobacterales bacterium]